MNRETENTTEKQDIGMKEETMKENQEQNTVEREREDTKKEKMKKIKENKNLKDRE